MSVCDVVSRYLRFLLTDCLQILVASASWDKGELSRFWGQKVKVQGRQKEPYVCRVLPVLLPSSIISVIFCISQHLLSLFTVVQVMLLCCVSAGEMCGTGVV